MIERQLFAGRQFTVATVALFLFSAGFAIVLLSTALFMQEVWHFSPLRAGVSIAPAPLASIAFAMNAGPIQNRFGRTPPRRDRHPGHGTRRRLLARRRPHRPRLLGRHGSRV
ncbi:hypothetical protein ACRAWF_00425 [Streptomyces sp. L7]